MILRPILPFLVILLSHFFVVPLSHSQGFRAVESGSAEAYRIQVRAQQQAAEMQRRHNESIKEWIATTKIKLPSFGDPPPEPHRHTECLDPKHLSDGDIGYLDYWKYEVFDIVGPKEVFLALNDPDIPPISLKDYPTEGLVDEEKVHVLGLVEVKGTTSYTNTLGSEVTLRVVRLVTTERQAEIEKDKEIQALADQWMADDLLFRTWTSSDGKFKVEAKFLEYKKGKVHLQKRDGTVIEVPSSKFSKEDRAYYRELVKSQKETLFVPKEF